MYCAKCQRIIATRSCMNCGSFWVREVMENDVCYLTEREQIWGEMLEDVLKKNGIPYIIRRTLGAGLSMSIGAMLECYRFYVPFAALEAAQEIVDELFPEDEWKAVEEDEAIDVSAAE